MINSPPKGLNFERVSYSASQIKSSTNTPENSQKFNINRAYVMFLLQMTVVAPHVIKDVHIIRRILHILISALPRMIKNMIIKKAETRRLLGLLKSQSALSCIESGVFS